MFDFQAPVTQPDSAAGDSRYEASSPTTDEGSPFDFGGGALFSRSVKLRQSLGVTLARDETTSRSSIVNEQRGDLSLGVSWKRMRISVPLFYNLQGQFDRRNSVTSGFGAGVGAFASVDLSRRSTLFAENFNSVFRSYAFSGDERSNAPVGLISGEGATGSGSSRTHLFLVGENWRPDALVSLTAQAQAFALIRGNAQASPIRERDAREVVLAGNYALTRQDDLGGRIRFARTAFEGPLGSQAFDLVLADLSFKKSLGIGTKITIGAGWMFLERGESPMRNRASGLALLDAKHERWKWKVGASQTIEPSAPGMRSAVSGALEHALSRRFAHFHAASYDLVKTEPSRAFGRGSRSHQLRLESGLRDNFTRRWLWGVKVESVRTEPVLEREEKNVSLIGFVQWAPLGPEGAN